MVSVGGDVVAELKYSLGEGARITGGLASLWKTRGMVVNVKMGMLESIVVLEALYGSVVVAGAKCEREKEGKGKGI